MSGGAKTHTRRADEMEPEVLSEQRDGYPTAPPLNLDNILVHVAGATLLLALLGWALWWMVPAVVGLGWAAGCFALVVGSLAGLFFADLISGLAHWAFDTWFDEKHPVFHRMVLIVREHHIAPQQMFSRILKIL